MKFKNLKKKIRRLEKRLLEGPNKLVRLRRKLKAMEGAKAVKRQRRLAARTRATRLKPVKERPSPKATGTKKPQAAVKKAKRKLNLSPERRAQLAAAMKARWAAKRASAEATSQTASTNRDFTLGQAPSGS